MSQTRREFLKMSSGLAVGGLLTLITRLQPLNTKPSYNVKAEDCEFYRSRPNTSIYGAEKLFHFLEDEALAKEYGDLLTNALLGIVEVFSWDNSIQSNSIRVENGEIVERQLERIDPEKNINVLYVHPNEEYTEELARYTDSETLSLMLKAKEQDPSLMGSYIVDGQENHLVFIYFDENDSYVRAARQNEEDGIEQLYCNPNMIKEIMNTVAHEYSHVYWGMNEINARSIGAIVSGITNENVLDISEPMTHSEYVETTAGMKLPTSYCSEANPIYCIGYDYAQGSVSPWVVDEDTYESIVGFFMNAVDGEENWRNLSEQMLFYCLPEAEFFQTFPSQEQ